MKRIHDSLHQVFQGHRLVFWYDPAGEWAETFRAFPDEKVAKLTVGDPAANHNLGPVVNKAALDSMLGYVETGKKEGRLIAGGNAPKTAEGGY